MRIPVPTTVGQNASIRFNFTSCTTAASPLISARVVYVGPKAIVLEDNASSLAGKIDADLISLAQDFETVSWPILLKFGDPLAYDAHTDANGRIIMMFTPRVNNVTFPGNPNAALLGFVQGCDIYAPSLSPAINGSNQAEIFYARTVSDTLPNSTSINGRSQWKRLMPSTLIHETKHLIANAEHRQQQVFQCHIFISKFFE